jgi:hypothetical protein
MRLGKDVRSDDNMDMRRVSWEANKKAMALAREALGIGDYTYRKVSPKAQWVLSMKAEALRDKTGKEYAEACRDLEAARWGSWLEEGRKPFSLVATEACKFFELPRRELVGRRQTKGVTLARQTVMYLARQYTGLSMPEIGRRLNRDHTTVLHAIRKVEGLLRDDLGFAKDVAKLRMRIDGA